MTPSRTDDIAAGADMKPQSFPEIAQQLIDVGKRFDARGWVLGTSGNFSSVLAHQPLKIAITPSAAFKGDLRSEDIVEVDERGAPVGAGRPSGETLVHLEIIRSRGAGAVLHTHSIWSTVLSDLHAQEGGFFIEGYEMLKGLDGVHSHDHREWVPIVENEQDMRRLARVVSDRLDRHPSAHGLLICRHGLYTWGANLNEAVRHVEILEFLLQAMGQTMAIRQAIARAAIES
jgi:methylthioribulose-1-phosphate dehydratase